MEETMIDQEVGAGTNPEPIGRATYSPEDNKLRLYPDARLDADTYKRVKAFGFGWAPKQGLFVASAWTPGRFDLLVDLCGEVGDEETTLQERAEDRAERFAKYKANRHRDAHAAADRVASLTEHVPLGQPILVGHHSQRAAERQAQKITRAMETAVDQWSRHDYWKGRIPAVLAHAEYKADEALRHRRIKGLESDMRKEEKSMAELELQLSKWNAPGLTLDQARHIANFSPYGCRLNCVKSPHGHYYSEYDVLQPDDERYATCPGMTVEQVVEIANKQLPRRMNRVQRWIDHYNLRLAYERELMEQGGGDMRDRWAHIEVGGRVQLSRFSAPGEWLTVLKVNKAQGRVSSMTVTATVRRNWLKSMRASIELVTNYEAPQEGVKERIKEATKLPPMVNYPGEGFKTMTNAEWMRLHNDYKGSHVVGATETHGAHRVRREWGGMRGGTLVYLSDKKTVMPPTKEPEPVVTPEPLPEKLRFELEPKDVAEKPAPRIAAEAEGTTVFDAIRETLKSGGVQTAVAHQLYPTPPEIAKRMVELADLESGMCVLEPSAGTGNIVQAVLDAVDTEVLAYEINQGLCTMLERKFPSWELQVRQRDFLEVTDFQGQYPRVLMNPPFENGVDIKHVMHALTFLREGGVLVGICANGPRQQDKIMPLCTSWEELPSGTFEGTGVRTALFRIDK